MATPKVSVNVKSESPTTQNNDVKKESEDVKKENEDVDKENDDVEKENDDERVLPRCGKPKKVSSEVDGHDNEFPYIPVQLISQNQENGVQHGHYLTLKTEMQVGVPIHYVTTDGDRNDKNAVWKHHTTMNGKHQIVILENEACSKREVSGKSEPCVLSVKQNEDNQYVISAKNIKKIPENLDEAEASIKFYKKIRTTGSTHVYFESFLSTETKRLLVGFDSSGQPLPMEEVNKYSYYYEPYFIIVHRM